MVVVFDAAVAVSAGWEYAVKVALFDVDLQCFLNKGV